MGLIASAAFLLATQTAPAVLQKTAPAPEVKVSQERIDEIWEHIDNRVIRQQDIWYQDGEFPTIVSLLKVQVGYQPDDYDTMTNLGWMQENIEEWADAEATYREFIRLHPKDGDAPFPLAWLFYNYKKRYEDAIKVLEASLPNKPGPNTYRVLAKSYERIKKYDQAIRVWELELKRWPGEPTAIGNIKRVKAKLANGGK